MRSLSASSASGVSAGQVRLGVALGLGSGRACARTAARAAAAPGGTPTSRASAGSASACTSTSGAPSTSSVPSSKAMPLHFQRDENGTSSRTPQRLAGELGVQARPQSGCAPPGWRRTRRAAHATSRSSAPESGTISSTASVPSVSVPVLSRQTTSSPASASTAGRRCTSAPRRPTRAAATAKTRLASSTRPSGTSETMPATAVETASRVGDVVHAQRVQRAGPRSGSSAPPSGAAAC